MTAAVQTQTTRRGRPVATFHPGRLLCECPHCPDTTHDGKLGTRSEWVWHDEQTRAAVEGR